MLRQSQRAVSLFLRYRHEHLVHSRFFFLNLWVQVGSEWSLNVPLDPPNRLVVWVTMAVFWSMIGALQ